MKRNYEGFLAITGAILLIVLVFIWAVAGPQWYRFTVHAKNYFDGGVYSESPMYALLVGADDASDLMLVEVSVGEFKRAVVGKKITIWRMR